jgi:hypothetical protein
VNNRIQISWESYFLFSFISILAVPLALVEQLSPIRFLVFCGIGLGVTSVIGLLVLPFVAFINPWLRKQSQRAQEVISVSIIGVSGALRGVLVYLSIEWLDYIQPSTIWARIGTSTATTLLWFTPIAIVVTSKKTFRADYEKLLRNAILTISRKISVNESDSLPAKLETDLLEIEEILGKALGNLEPSTSPESLTFAVSWIKALVEEKIRPLSHRLWIESISKPPKIHFSTSIFESVRFLNVPPAPVALFLSLISFINVSASIGWVRGIFGAFVILVEVYSLLYLYRRKTSQFTARHVLINGFLLLIPGLLLSLTFYLSNKFLFGYSFGLLNLMYVLLFLMVAIPVSTFQLTNRDRAQLLTAIEENLLTTGWLDEFHQKYLTQNAAAYLHNLLQSELLAISRHMELFTDPDESVNSSQEIKDLLIRLNRPIKDDFQKYLYDPITRLNKLQAAWKGIADIDISIPTNALQNQYRNLLLVQFVEESIANAVRHANADKITVRAQLLPSQEVRFSIVNNGISEGQDSVGMGTAWLDHHAPNSWSRRQTEKGIEVIITL